ncbi:MAG: hypothetical protein Q3971_08670 [Moraxella sp.]|nr:hypothetical protein [Moraxella sp.]
MKFNILNLQNPHINHLLPHLMGGNDKYANLALLLHISQALPRRP